MELFLSAGAILLIILARVVTRRKCAEPQVAMRDPNATESYFDAEAVESSTDGIGIEAIASGAIH